MLDEAALWVTSLFGLNPSSKLAGSLVFFLADAVKILLLLAVAIFLIGTLRSYVPAEKVKAFLARRHPLMGHVAASTFGAITPFCSCSSIPLFVSFLDAGVPLGVSLSFLITSPLVNEYMAILMLLLFGWKIMVAYIAAGMLLGIVGGIVLGKMRLERHLIRLRARARTDAHAFRTFSDCVRFGLDESLTIFKKLWLWILAGVAVGALIHNYVPQAFLERAVGAGGIFTVPIAVLIGVPLYGSSSALVPVAAELFAKGVPLGTALAFIMAVSALSFPEAVILRRVMRLRLILIFFGFVALGIVIVGYTMNAFAGILL